MANKFGDNVKRLRTDNNISQQELADMIGIHATHVSRYERNLAAPSIDVAKKMAEALQVTMDTLVYGAQDEKAKNSLQDGDLLQLFTKVQQLDKGDLATVKTLLKAFLFQKDTQARLLQ